MIRCRIITRLLKTKRICRTGQIFSAGCCFLVTVRAVFTADITEIHAVFAAAAVLAVSPSFALTVAAVGTWSILIFSFIEIQLMAVCTDLTAAITDIAAVFAAMAQLAIIDVPQISAVIIAMGRPLISMGMFCRNKAHKQRQYHYNT